MYKGLQTIKHSVEYIVLMGLVIILKARDDLASAVSVDQHGVKS